MPRKSLPLLLAAAALLAAQTAAPIRPPAVPLIVHDPYFSIWSFADTLTEEPTKHWTGADQPLTGILQIDGKSYRFLGTMPRRADPIPAMTQSAFRITPTRTIYTFQAAGIQLDLTFLTPALPHDLDVLARPLTYLLYSVRAIDGARHRVRFYLDADSRLVNNTSEQQAMWSRYRAGELEVIRLAGLEQNVLAKSGDRLRIDWGHFYLAAPAQPGRVRTLGATSRTRDAYLDKLDTLPAESNDLDIPMQNSRILATAALTADLGEVAADAVSSYVLAAYDDLYSIEYFHQKLRPWWRRSGHGADWLLRTAAAELDALRQRSVQFDEDLTAALAKTGGEKYAALCIVAYRQAIAAHKLVADSAGRPLHLSKENASNGSIGTVDVLYPGAPLFLLLNPTLVEGQLRPILDYAQSGRWPWPYAPHDLGQYPIANGQGYGGGEDNEDRQMPVEESGNMIIALAALTQAKGDAAMAREYWPLITRWAEFLRDKGLDPDNQLNTDDFAGHTAHNANLSLKAIVALACYSRLAEKVGRLDVSKAYRALAEDMVRRWVALADDGDHFRLTFDQPGTWSQKYNLVWDKLLDLKLFPPEVSRKEIAFYKTKQNAFGLPLDSRSGYTKLDWILWTATMAESPEDFAALADPAYRFANETPTRVPLSDWYWTADGKQRGFQARSVVGGLFIPMLADPAVWRRWVAYR
ncbi:MAG: DUF4965 domain-containing protein [Bryobacteraceae bacterium]